MGVRSPVILHLLRQRPKQQQEQQHRARRQLISRDTRAASATKGDTWETSLTRIKQRQMLEGPQQQRRDSTRETSSNRETPAAAAALREQQQGRPQEETDSKGGAVGVSIQLSLTFKSPLAPVRQLHFCVFLFFQIKLQQVAQRRPPRDRQDPSSNGRVEDVDEIDRKVSLRDTQERRHQKGTPTNTQNISHTEGGSINILQQQQQEKRHKKQRRQTERETPHLAIRQRDTSGERETEASRDRQKRHTPNTHQQMWCLCTNRCRDAHHQ